MSSAWRRLAPASALLVVVATLAGCGSGSGSAQPSGAASGSLMGTVDKNQIQPPSDDLLKVAGISKAEADKAVEISKSWNWQLVQVNGLVQAVACTGTGSPTVVYSNGLIVPASWTWPIVVQKQSTTNRTCVFDRPGTGLSQARTSTSGNGPVANADEMLSAMATVGEKGPFVVVGWSYGGMIAQVAAASHPDVVSGVVLIDSVTPTQYRTFDKDGWNEGGADLDMAAGEHAVAQPNWGQRPLASLIAGRESADDAAEISQTDWVKQSEQLAAHAPNHVVGIVKDAEHTIPQSNPDAVVAATNAVLESIKSGQSLPACPSTFATAGITCVKGSQ